MKKLSFALLALSALPMTLLASCDSKPMEVYELTTSNVEAYIKASYQYDEERTLEVGNKNIYVMLNVSLNEGYKVVEDCSLVFDVRVTRESNGFNRKEELVIAKGESSASLEHVVNSYTNILPSDTVTMTYYKVSGKVTKA